MLEAYSGYGFYPNDAGALNTTCEDLNMISDETWVNMDGVHLIIQTLLVRPALGYSYDTNWNYCNLDSGKYRTIRSGSDNGSVYLAGAYTFDNGVEINADIHYWETEANNVYYPYFVQQNYMQV